MKTLKTTLVDEHQLKLVEKKGKFWLQVIPLLPAAAERFTAIRRLPGNQAEAEEHFERAIQRAIAMVVPEELNE